MEEGLVNKDRGALDRADICESHINTGQIRGQIVANNDTQTQIENTSSG